MARVLPILLLTLAVAAAAVAVNLALLGRARGGDPVGNLSPVAPTLGPAPGAATSTGARTTEAHPGGDRHHGDGSAEDD